MSDEDNISLLFCFLLVSFCNGEKLPIVYVSSSEGNGLYDGSSPEKPTNNILKAVRSADVVLLKVGDVFCVGGLSIDGIKLSRYGDGSNPTICGYKRIVETRWVEVEKNIWKLNLVEDNFIGIVLEGPIISVPFMILRMT